jgi:hypothetical protein
MTPHLLLKKITELYILLVFILSIFKSRPPRLIRDESLMNLEGRGLNLTVCGIYTKNFRSKLHPFPAISCYNCEVIRIPKLYELTER